jgi:uroporphyrin-III C-methyltransferase/precorrin-2 dehydrogenase/sirohydrochlorin ferrochelatase/uroporphyrin-III C-methyltransferase
MRKNLSHIGKVILAAAGCGDPELITVKAARYLQQADVVLADRLVSEMILKSYVPASAEIIFSGKQNNNPASFSQQNINQLLVNYALQGKLVVRLKGGDIAFFSNVLDELESLVANNIPYEIVPGVTAASGASAYAGIPLTARGFSTSVRFLTFYKDSIFNSSYWKELASTNDTLVFYMSSENVESIVENLLGHDIDPEKQLAIVQQATTEFQQVDVIKLDEYRNNEKLKDLASPTLLIIGKVAALHEKFSWLSNSNERKYYFRPVELNTKPLNVDTNVG